MPIILDDQIIFDERQAGGRNSRLSQQWARKRNKTCCNLQQLAAFATGAILIGIIALFHYHYQKVQEQSMVEILERRKSGPLMNSTWTFEDDQMLEGNDGDDDDANDDKTDDVAKQFKRIDEELRNFTKKSFSGGDKQWRIPKIFHQQWKNVKVPKRYRNYRENWLKLHNEESNWKHQLWTDALMKELIRRHYSWFLNIYLNLPKRSMRVDCNRYILMHRYGGMYADMDMEPLVALDFLIDNATLPITLAYLSEDYKDRRNVQPCWILSSSGHHSLWLLTLMEVQTTFTLNKTNRLSFNNDRITGSRLLYHSILAYSNLQRQIGQLPSGSIEFGSKECYDINLLAPGSIYPNRQWSPEFTAEGVLCSKESAKQNETACKLLFPEAYTVKYSPTSAKKLF